MVAVLLVVTAGVVMAQSSTMTKGCYGKKTGILRYVPSGPCTTLENPISWNQVGPQGPPGAQGPQGEKGDTGAQGPRGPSPAYVTGPNFRTSLNPASSVSSLRLPAGKYLISVNMNLDSLPPSTRSAVVCQVTEQPDPPFSFVPNTPVASEVLEDLEGDGVDTMAFTFSLELATGQDIHIMCGANSAQVRARFVYMTALQVENLIRQQ